MEEQDTLGDALAREVAEDEAGADGRTELDGEEKEEPSKPATLLWLIQKLARTAKLEAAYTPRNPLKVPQATKVSVVRVFCCCCLKQGLSSVCSPGWPGTLLSQGGLD